MRTKFLVVGIALAGAGLWWWKHPTKPTAESPQAPPAPAAAASAPPQTVGVIKALKQDVPVRLEASGTVTAINSVDLRAQTTTTVAQVLVKDGQSVKKGELLFRFDDRADRAALDKARAQLQRDRATLADLERQHRRAVELLSQKFVAQSAVDTALANLEAGQALVKSDEVAVRAAEVQLSYSELRAPISGRVGAVNVFPGSLVQAAAAAPALLNIAQIDPIAIAFNLPETELAPLLAAARGGTEMAAEAVLPSAAKGAPPVIGKVVFVDNSVDASTGTIKVKAQFDNKAEQLWPGQYLKVRITLRTLKDAVVIPQAAIILRGQERSVYIVAPDGSAKQVPIQVQRSFGEMAAVSGIEAGMAVVVDGKQNLRPGTPLKVQATQVNPAAKPASAPAQAPASAAS